MLRIFQEEFEDTKEVIRIRLSTDKTKTKRRRTKGQIIIKYCIINKWFVTPTLMPHSYKLIDWLLSMKRIAVIIITITSLEIINHDGKVRVMVFNATFNNIAVIWWRSVLLVEETGVPRENYRPVTSRWQILSHNVLTSTSRHERDSNSHL